MDERDLERAQARALAGGAPKYHEKNAEQGKLFARERIAYLVDADSFCEDALLANSVAADLPADGVITGTARVGGRVVAIMANDSTVKAGSWGKRTVEMFPGRRGAGRIFYNQVGLSGLVPQVCLLFGPSAAGGAYIPAFCDVVVMVDGNASMYLGSPRMAEMVIGEQVTLEEMGGAKMHTSVSGCGDVLVASELEAIAFAKSYLALLPSNHEQRPPHAEARAPKAGLKPLREIIVADENKPFDMRLVIEHIVDEGSLLEIKARFAKEMITAFARIDGRVVGIVANQPKYLGGVLFVDSADKAARFIWLCDAFNVPLLFLADVPGFMIGTKVERQGIIRAGAKMIAAVSEATVAKISVVVRKAYGAGLYAMCGPAFEPDACIALPTASIAVMGPQAAVNAVYYNKIQEVPAGPERDAYVAKLRDEYRADIDVMKLASELVIDAVVPGERLRGELVTRFERYADKQEPRPRKKHLVPPV